MGSSANIYTVLLLVAALSLVAAVAYVLIRSSQLFGGNPFSVQSQAVLDAVRVMF